ncbi:MAG TPA: TraR/DksA C4-type zinc finger protein [Gaiellaceae bacterium]|nr:TraR/DksA C4-type zinc finger protein [Gaiellaceae bacterium]
MSDIDTTEFRKLLEDERGRLMQASGRLESDTNEDLGEERGVENHLGDQASETADRELEEGLDEGVRQTLRQIEDALKRIDDGTYGTCEIDEKPIPEDRLRALPWTTRCIEHAQ